jgi:hypothetical protein
MIDDGILQSSMGTLGPKKGVFNIFQAVLSLERGHRVRIACVSTEDPHRVSTL